MEFFEETIEKVKEAFDVAQKKTTEIVSVGKQKYDIAAMESKLGKMYTKLGKIVYPTLTGDEQGEVAQIVNEIKEQLSKIEEAKEELSKLKNKRICPKCNSIIEETAVYCSVCGEKITFTE